MGGSVKHVAGVDTHKDTHSIVVIDRVGVVVAQFTIAATLEGYAQAISRVSEFEGLVWGIEGTGSYGRGFVDELLRHGASVFDVPGSLTKRHRKNASRRGKSDLQDAHAIAEVVLRESGRLSRCERYDEQEAVRVLYDRRDRLVQGRTEAINRIRAGALRLDVRDLPANLTTTVGLRKVQVAVDPLRGSSHTADALIAEIEEAVTDVGRISERIRALEKQIRPFVERLAGNLLRLDGASVVVAAGLIGHSGPLRNIRNAAAFAMRAGVAPVPCSSGKSQSVRVNTGGNRQLNRCLHVMALVQIRRAGHAGRVYYDRKRGEGKTHRAAMRALKRQLATVVYYRLAESRRLLERPMAAA
jgi:transposase